jgi:hypothetical protein
MPIRQSIPSTTTSTTTIACQNDFFELIAEGLSNVQNSTQLVLDHINRVFDKGLVKTNCGSCCPSCGDYYILANSDTYSIWSDNVGQNIDLDCCSNNAILNDNFQLEINNNCNNNFTTCIQNLNSIIPAELLAYIANTGGIVEYSKLTGSGSILCGFITLLQTSPLYNTTLLYDAIEILFDKGIVIYCNEEITVVGSVETFLKYYEATI